MFATNFNKPPISISDKVFDALRQYDFPGNVRELKNMAERAVILCKSPQLKVSDFPIKQQTAKKRPAKSSSANLQTNEIKIILEALRNHNYNQTAAAESIGISRNALIRRMKKYNIAATRSEN